MGKINFLHSHTLINDEIIAKHVARLEAETVRMREALSDAYTTPYASLNLPSDTVHHRDIEIILDRIRLQKPRICIIVGIGGSNLGTYAVWQALYGSWYNETDPPCRVYYSDTVDPLFSKTMCTFMQRAFNNGDTVLINLISKSGTTLESIVNFSVLCEVLRTYHPETWQQYIIITTEHNSPLWHYAHDNKIRILEIPALVGGRFSVFSAVGLFPLGLLGINIHQLCAGARDALRESLTQNIPPDRSIAAISAAITYEQYLRGIKIHDTFVFSPNLEGFGKWYRQLCGESLGKENKQHHPVGITPTVSVGSTDLHSVGQLYLGGPNNRLTTFIKINQTETVSTKHSTIFDYAEKEGADKSLSTIMDAIIHGTCITYQELNRPYMLIELSDLSAYTLGNLMQYKMIEILYLGYLLGVNPFDQPHVDRYKEKTRMILS